MSGDYVTWQDLLLLITVLIAVAEYFRTKNSRLTLAQFSGYFY